MTGYVYDMVRRHQSFAEFTWSCARAFGALITMRDAANDAKIDIDPQPAKFYTDAVSHAEAKLAEWNAMSQAEKLAFLEQRRIDRINERKAEREKEYEETFAMTAMRNNVLQWHPPTEHEELKRFMLDQLRQSFATPCHPFGEDDPFRDPVTSSDADAELKRREEVLFRSQRDLAKEVHRVNERRAWLQKLNESVPIPESMKAADEVTK
jgi:hypothetical protein